jgi:hypothetical protein
VTQRKKGKKLATGVTEYRSHSFATKWTKSYVRITLIRQVYYFNFSKTRHLNPKSRHIDPRSRHRNMRFISIKAVSCQVMQSKVRIEGIVAGTEFVPAHFKS